MAAHLIQQHLDETERLICAIIDEQKLGKLEDSARNLERLQQNLDCLAALTDNQPPQHPTAAQQAQLYPANAPVEPVPQVFQSRQAHPSRPSAVVQTQQGQPMNSQISMVARPAMLHDQMHTQDQLQQQQMQHAALHGGTSGTSVFHGQTINGSCGMLTTGAYSSVDGSSGAGSSILPGTLSSAEGQGAITMPDYPSDSEQQGENWDVESGEILDLLLYNDEQSCS